MSNYDSRLIEGLFSFFPAEDSQDGLEPLLPEEHASCLPLLMVLAKAFSEMPYAFATRTEQSQGGQGLLLVEGGYHLGQQSAADFVFRLAEEANVAILDIPLPFFEQKRFARYVITFTFPSDDWSQGDFAHQLLRGLVRALNKCKGNYGPDLKSNLVGAVAHEYAAALVPEKPARMTQQWAGPRDQELSVPDQVLVAFRQFKGSGVLDPSGWVAFALLKEAIPSCNRTKIRVIQRMKSLQFMSVDGTLFVRCPHEASRPSISFEAMVLLMQLLPGGFAFCETYKTRRLRKDLEELLEYEADEDSVRSLHSFLSAHSKKDGSCITLPSQEIVVHPGKPPQGGMVVEIQGVRWEEPNLQGLLSKKFPGISALAEAARGLERAIALLEAVRAERLELRALLRKSKASEVNLLDQIATFRKQLLAWD